MKYRRVINDIIPCVVVTSVETDAFMAIIAYIDMLRVGSNPVPGRKEGAQGAVAILKEKNVQGCVSQNSDPMNSILQKVEELGLNAPAACTCYETKIRERKRQSGGIIQKGEPHERNSCASSFEEQPPEETPLRADCDSNVTSNLARKMHMLSRRDLGLDEMDTLRRSKNPFTVLTATWESAKKRGNTSFRS